MVTSEKREMFFMATLHKVAPKDGSGNRGLSAQLSPSFSAAKGLILEKYGSFLTIWS